MHNSNNKKKNMSAATTLPSDEDKEYIYTKRPKKKLGKRKTRTYTICVNRKRPVYVDVLCRCFCYWCCCYYTFVFETVLFK